MKEITKIYTWDIPYTSGDLIIEIMKESTKSTTLSTEY